MIFKSQQVSLDPEPRVNLDERGHEKPGTRHARYRDCSALCVDSPRPEFEPTRDPYPWEIVVTATGTVRERIADPSWVTFWDAKTEVCEWAPRRSQFDTPVNRVLVLFRKQLSPVVPLNLHIHGFLNGITRLASEGFTIAEIDHARKVLTRLATLTKEA